jgi:hypothetical protein
MEKYDFSGWATRNDLLCADGRTIRKDAFKHNDGQTVPLVWNHNHNEPDNVLGHALLENRDEGVYAYCTFNNSDSGKAAKEAVRHGDVRSLSIYANKLKQSGGDVLHGFIREVSIVLAGANPGAFIESVMMHGEDAEDGIVYGCDENIMLHHYTETTEPLQTVEETENLQHAENNKEEKENMADTKKETQAAPEAETKAAPAENTEKTVKDVFDTLTEEQKTVVYALIGQALEDAGVTDDEDDNEAKHSEGGNNDMKNNIFDRDDEQVQGGFLSHADQEEILSIAKTVGSLKKAVEMWGNDHLQHGFGAEDGEPIDVLFTDFKNVPAEPSLLERDMDWVANVMSKATKSPIARVRTRHIDARASEITAKAHTKGETKKAAANMKLLKRETNPQTVYIKDSLHRDDVTDMDFDGIAYLRKVMKNTLEETIALAALVGDTRNDEADKISDENIRPIWTDSDFYTIHETVDVAGMKTKLQGTGTGANFGEEFIYAEAIIAALMNARIQYKGKGALDFYCSPVLLNKMLMARDMNGRRIYDSTADLCKVLNVAHIYDVEQFNGLAAREDAEGKRFNLLGIFVNMNNYQFGCAKGGEVTSFEDFDIDLNQHKYLMETRLSGALIDPYSAIVLEEAVAAG